MKTIATVLTSVLFLACSQSSVQAEGKAENGKVLAQKNCTPCHVIVTDDIHTMFEIARILDDEQIEALAVYFASHRRQAVWSHESTHRRRRQWALAGPGRRAIPEPNRQAARSPALSTSPIKHWMPKSCAISFAQH